MSEIPQSDMSKTTAAGSGASSPLCAEDADLFAEVCDETEISTKYLSIFIDESLLSLDTLTNTLLAIEAEGGGATDENLLITTHRIKGSAATVGLNRPAKLAHFMEDVLQELRETGDTLGVELVDALLKCTDGLHEYVDGLKSGDPKSETFNDLSHELLRAQAINVKTGATDDENASARATEIAREAPDATIQSELNDQLRKQISETAPLGSVGYLGVVRFKADLPLAGLKARLIYEKMSQMGDVFYCDPDADALESSEGLSAMSFGVATDLEMASVSGRLKVAGIERTEIEPFVASGRAVAAQESARQAAATSESAATTTLDTPADPTPKKAGSSTRSSGQTSSDKGRIPAPNKPNETLRVDIDRLDDLMNLAGQLVISKSRFFQISEGMKHLLNVKNTSRLVENAASLLQMVSADLAACGSKGHLPANLEAMSGHVQRLQIDMETVRQDVERFAKARAGIANLCDAVHHLDRITDGIQKSVMDTRMVPIGPLFNRFKRVIRDITRDNGKNIGLIIRGDKTELDKRMIDELGDPLIHMVRNSVDHGIELPDVREAAGKPREGSITLNAFHRGNSIVIQVADDGKGLDVDRIREKAIARGVVTAEDALQMTNHELFQLIWAPGFTTAEVVTEVSGRGMGMDIVRSKIEEINGQVELDSEPGVGTTFTIKLPLTLAILPSLMAKVDGEVFALPVESVKEIVSIAPDDFSTIHQMRTALVRGRVVSVVCLRDLFSWNRAPVRPTNRDAGSEDTTLVVISDAGQELAIVVDELLGEEDIVIKSMAENYQHVAGVAGASILGDGRVSLILDVSALIGMSSQKASEFAVTKEQKHERSSTA